MNSHKLIVFLLALLPAIALAQAVQPCVVKQYNQKETKTPLAGVQVEVRGAGTEVSDAQGVLTLSFTTLKPGDRVTMRSVTKSGYEIFNTSAVEQWTISRDRTPFHIVLVKSEYMSQLKRSLREISTENYKVKYEQAKRELKAEKEAGKLKDEEYRQQMEALEDQYDNALKDLDNYIDQFAHFDLNEVSAEEQRILEMVQQGQINEAVEAYEALNLNGKLLQERADLKKLDEAANRVEAEKARKEENIAQLKEALDREITTLKLAGGADNYAKIGRMLKEQALADTTDYEAVEKYAGFAVDQRDYLEAVRTYLMCLEQVHGDLKQESHVFSSLGMSYSLMGDNYEAEKVYLNELQNRTTLYEIERDNISLSNLACVQINLGNTYRHLQDTIKAGQFLKQGFENSEKLFANDTSYRSRYAHALHSMGSFYSDRNDYVHATYYFEKAFEHFSILYQQNNRLFHSAWAFAMKSLAGCYYRTHDFSKAEQYYLKALEEFAVLSQQNPKADLPGLASTQNELGDLYKETGNHAKKCQYYAEALANYNTLSFQYSAVIDSLKYCKQRAELQINMGFCFWLDSDFPQAIQHFDLAYRNFNLLIQKDTIKYLPWLGVALRGLAGCYYDSGDLATSEKWYLAVLENDDQLLKMDYNMFRVNRIAEIQKILGDIYSANQDLAKAITYYQAALENKIVLLQKDTSAHCEDAANIELKLGRTYYAKESYKEAEQHYISALGYVEWLFHHDTSYRTGVAMIQQELGGLYAAMNELDKVERYYLAALDNKMILMQQDTNAYLEDVTSLELTMGQIYAYTQNYEKAEKYYTSALEHCTWMYARDSANYQVGMVTILNGLSYVYAYNNKFPKALSTIEKAIALMPNEPNYYDSKGEILLMSGDEQGALIMWRKVLELDPDFLKHLEENGSESELYNQLKKKGLVE